jgi:hypothetical protein
MIGFMTGERGAGARGKEAAQAQQGIAAAENG